MKLQGKKKAYWFLVSNESRDFYLILPFVYYLEKFENYEISLEFVWDAHKIKQSPPDLVILPNSRGHNLYYEIAAYARDNGILVFAHESEGNFTPSDNFDYWAYNREQKTICPVIFSWNKRVKEFLIRKYNLNENIIQISGGMGFDKYKYTTRRSRKDILEKYNLHHFNKVIGYAGWAFGKLYNKEINDVLSVIQKPGEEGKVWLNEQCELVEDCLKQAILTYPDTLFILKKHPRENFESDLRDSKNEMNRLKDYPNVLYLKDEEEIQDLIQISDLWVAFESTSIMEAWFMDIPTVMINPDINFKRAEIYKGSKIVKTPDEFVDACNEAVNKRNLEYFEPIDVIQEREKIIELSIGYSDGLNHLRCAKIFKPYLTERNNQKIKTNFKFLKLYWLLHLGKHFYIPSLFKRLPKLKKTVWVFENRKLNRLKKVRPEVYKELDKFYIDKNISTLISTGEIWDKI